MFNSLEYFNFFSFACSVVEYARKYTFDLELPQLYTEGAYDIDGRILLIPVKGSGRFHGNFSEYFLVFLSKIIKNNFISLIANALAHVVVNQERVTKSDGQVYSIVKKINIKIRVRNGKIHLDNLFGGDKTLGEVVNETINRNFDVLSKEIIPLIERALSKHFKKVGNKILGSYPESVLFP